ncbi:MAG TPA: hypothetical protein VLI90_04105 [Tepidisphaeraceae bacterium]|nr:hypothetical protein [Tepidisphaeraceae bacterium]
MAQSPAFTRFMDSAKPDSDRWRAGKGYDLDAVEEMTDDERAEVVRFLCDRETITWREVEVLIVLDPVVAEQALDRAEGKRSSEDEVVARRSAKLKSKSNKRAMASAEPTHTPAYTRFMAKMNEHIMQWPDGQTYDVSAIAEMNDVERTEIVQLLGHRGTMSWREVQVLSAIDTPEARAAVDAASNDHLSPTTRLTAGAAMHAAGRLPEFELFLAKQIRSLSKKSDGMDRALELARQQPTETIKQALLWASWNQTECAPPCAATLCVLSGRASGPDDPALAPMLQKLGVHNSYFDRKKAFEELSKLVGMELDTSQE